jgi:hypothetical protein
METRHEDLKREMPSKCKKEWDDDPKIRQEFGTLEAYTAFRIAEESGSTSISPDPKRPKIPDIEPPKESPWIPLKRDPNKPVQKALANVSVNAEDMKGKLAEQCIAQWKADPAIRHEFGSVGAYFAFCSNNATNPMERN